MGHTKEIARKEQEAETHGLLDWIPRPAWLSAVEQASEATPMRIEERVDGNEFVVRAEMPGIDPAKDVEINVHGVGWAASAHPTPTFSCPSGPDDQHRARWRSASKAQGPVVPGRDLGLWMGFRNGCWVGSTTSTRERAMYASAGDRLIIKGHHVGEPDRDAEILDVLGEDGGPPYRIRWEEDGHEGLFFPGPDAVLQHDGGDPSCVAQLRRAGLRVPSSSCAARPSVR